ncbi:MAG: hypothetical protein ACLRXQ_01370 [Phascolarctobacterium faecium]
MMLDASGKPTLWIFTHEQVGVANRTLAVGLDQVVYAPPAAF